MSRGTDLGAFEGLWGLGAEIRYFTFCTAELQSTRYVASFAESASRHPFTCMFYFGSVRFDY